MMEDAILAGNRVADPAQPTMMFGTCELTATELQTGHPADLLDLLMRHGVKRLAAERILEIHCSGTADVNTGRARSHPTSRGGSSLR